MNKKNILCNVDQSNNKSYGLASQHHCTLTKKNNYDFKDMTSKKDKHTKCLRMQYKT